MHTEIQTGKKKYIIEQEDKEHLVDRKSEVKKEKPFFFRFCLRELMKAAIPKLTARARRAAAPVKVSRVRSRRLCLLIFSLSC